MALAKGEMRIWFAEAITKDEMEDAMSFLKGLAEEIILSGGKLRVEIYSDKHVPIREQDTF